MLSLLRGIGTDASSISVSLVAKASSDVTGNHSQGLLETTDDLNDLLVVQ